MEKIIQKLPKLIFDFIQNERFVENVAMEQNHWKERVLLKILTHEFSLGDTKFETVVQALANSYEVEETPEDKVRIDFDKAHYDSLGEALAYRKGIMRTLELFNIKIEGIN